MANTRINTRGFDQKIKRMSVGINVVLFNLIRDAAAFIKAKMVNEVLNGPAGQDSPKSGYAAGVGEGERGFIGVVSGNLKRSIQIQQQGQLKYFVFSETVVAPYNEEANQWVQDRYGKGYFDIVAILYVNGMLDLFLKEITRYTLAVSNSSVYTYQNPFPD